MNTFIYRIIFTKSMGVTFIILCLFISTVNVRAQTENWYVANKEDLKTFFEAVVSRTGNGVIVSKQAARKKINGRFNINDTINTIKSLSKQMGLIWYTDGNIIYIYDSSEMKSGLIQLQNTSITELNEFLIKSGIYDEMYKIKGGSNGTYYISGPPVYVDLVVKSAKMIDQNSDGIEIGRQKIGVIHLINTFVTDRTYELRNEKIIIPGISTIVADLLNVKDLNRKRELSDITSDYPQERSLKMPPLPEFSDDKVQRNKFENITPTIFTTDDDIRITAYPGNNTILVKGTYSQVEFVRKLIKSLDIPKRHIELSLWIIDINKSDLESLGADWSGRMDIGSKVSVSFNQSNSISTLDGARFIANIQALEQKKRATVISRPVILTQENIPAIFDNNRSFYTKLIGERNSKLESVTYGTMISVLPRFGRENQIELLLNIEDGNKDENEENRISEGLPDIGRTVISTIARVPQGKSLLVGGYTKEVKKTQVNKIPFLGSIPIIGHLFSYEGNNESNVIRVFLIQPREVTELQMMSADTNKQKIHELKKEYEDGSGLSDAFLDKWVNAYFDQ